MDVIDTAERSQHLETILLERRPSEYWTQLNYFSLQPYTITHKLDFVEQIDEIAKRKQPSPTNYHYYPPWHSGSQLQSLALGLTDQYLFDFAVEHSLGEFALGIDFEHDRNGLLSPATLLLLTVDRLEQGRVKLLIFAD